MNIKKKNRDKIRVPVVIEFDVTEQNGWYTATTPLIDGLIVSHKDYDTMLKEIPECLTMLERIQNA